MSKHSEKAIQLSFIELQADAIIDYLRKQIKFVFPDYTEPEVSDMMLKIIQKAQEILNH